MTLDDKNSYVHKRASFDSTPTFNTLIPILQLCAYDTEWEGTEYVMLLQPLQPSNQFKRLGLGIITWRRLLPEEGQSWRSGRT